MQPYLTQEAEQAVPYEAQPEAELAVPYEAQPEAEPEAELAAE